MTTLRPRWLRPKKTSSSMDAWAIGCRRSRTWAGAPLPSATGTSGSITTSGAAISGNNVSADGGAPITERGVVYAPTATNSNPLIGGTGVVKVTAGGATGVLP